MDAQVLSLMVIAVAITLKDEFCRTLTTVHSHLAEQDLRECKDCLKRLLNLGLFLLDLLLHGSVEFVDSPKV